MTAHDRRPISFHEQRLRLMDVEITDLYRQQAHLTSRIKLVRKDSDDLKRALEIANKRGYKSFDRDALLNTEKKRK